ncbi:MAG: hypothetical protein ACUVXA_09355 [Candidatus Jordarchaeum sp.]|uniref:hypothetical protein n=1 Tax=Candidatus Jordarchaeum sp. TaxID=2823881 RepID=UPI00404A8456
MALISDYQTIPLLTLAYKLYLRISYFTVFWPGSFILLCFFPVLLPFGQDFRSLSKNFESFDEAWGAFKAFIRECSKKNKLMLSIPLAYFSIGLSFSLLWLLVLLPYDSSFIFFYLYLAVNFLYSSPLGLYLVLLSLMHYAQTELMSTIVVVLFIPLVVFLIIGLFYESAFQNELKSLSPESFKSST